MKYNTNLARAPPAVADSLEIPLPPCFQRTFLIRSVQRFKRLNLGGWKRDWSNVQGKPACVWVGGKVKMCGEWKSFHLRKLLPFLPSTWDTRLSDTLDVGDNFYLIS